MTAASPGIRGEAVGNSPLDVDSIKSIRNLSVTAPGYNRHFRAARDQTGNARLSVLTVPGPARRW